MRILLRKELLFEIDSITIPSIPWSRIYDNPLDSTPFQNFLGDN